MADIKDNDFLKKHRTEWQDFLWEKFLDRLSGEKSGKGRGAISALFSEYEKRLIAQRLAILVLLREGKGPREISRLLFVSRNTVTASRKNFFSNHSIYQSQRNLPTKKRIVIKTLFKERDRWLEELFRDINLWEIIKNPPRPRGMGIKN